jgi:hypothetical protein
LVFPIFHPSPKQSPKNYPKLVFDCFGMILQNVAKRSENQAAQKCSISYCVICEKRGFEALRFKSMCLDVPS